MSLCGKEDMSLCGKEDMSLCGKEDMSLCERDPCSEDTPMYPVEAEAKSDCVKNIEIITETEVEESICPVDTMLPDTNTVEENNLCDKEVIEPSPCDKEN